MVGGETFWWRDHTLPPTQALLKIFGCRRKASWEGSRAPAAETPRSAWYEAAARMPKLSAVRKCFFFSENKF